MKVRKKPVVVVEAIQFTGPQSVTQMCSDWGDSFKLKSNYVDFLNQLTLKTLEGPHYVNISDWVIRGVKGEFYNCREDIFNQTYDLV